MDVAFDTIIGLTSAGRGRGIISAERRAPSAERRAPSAERRAPSAERRNYVRLAAAVLALAFGLTAFLPTASAQTAVWSATLTADATATGNTGCDNTFAGLDNCSSALTNDSFTYQGTEYQVVTLMWQPSASTILLTLNKAVPSSLRSSGILRIGNLSLRFAGGIWSATLADELNFNIGAPGWYDGQQLSVRLTVDPTRPAKPTGLRAIPGDREVTLLWDNPNDPSIRYYDVQVGREGNPSAIRRRISLSGASPQFYTVKRLPNDTEHTFSIQASDIGGRGPVSERVMATPVAGAGTTHHGVKLSDFKVTQDARQLELKWRMHDDDVGRLPHCGYVLEWREGTSGGWKRVEFETYGVRPMRTISNLRPSTTYQVRLFVQPSLVTQRPELAFERTVTTSRSSHQHQGEPEATSGALTASVAAAPAEHAGKGFAVRIQFSDAVTVGAKAALAASTLRVDGGKVTRARRAAKRKDLWELRVKPAGDGAVTVALAATAECSAAGAVCTADGRRLETALAVTVPGPAALTVRNETAREGAGAALRFRVSLSRGVAGPVTVDYATRDGSAKAGEDYEAASGTLVFAPGETRKTVSVALLDDAHDEGEETFTLALSNAGGARIADGTATGMIKNADPLQQAWLARFGRAAASDAIAAVTARFETPRDAGSHLTLDGYRLSLDGSGAGQPPAPAGGPGGSHWLAWSEDPEASASRTMDARALLMGTSFRAVLGQGSGSRFTSWGQGASVSGFSGSVPGLSLSGESATGALGMDWESGRLLTGFALTHSLGEGTAQGAGRSYAMGSTVTTALPFARLAISDRVSAWSMAGTGSGELTLDLDGGGSERYRVDLSMTLAAMGVRGELVTPAEAGGFSLALKADAFWVRTESDSVSAPGAGNLAAARADASRLRAVLDGSRTFALAGGGTLAPSVELGLRHDGGDAETGTGTELGAGVGYADPSRGLDMALRVHGLAGHAEDGYREWGVSGSLRLVPGGTGRGLTLSLTPSWGADPEGSERLWTMPDAHALAANDDADPASRLDTEVGYGLGGPAGLGVLTPYAALGLAGDDARTWRAGARWSLAPDMSLGLEGTRSESAADPAEHGAMLRGAVRW